MNHKTIILFLLLFIVSATNIAAQNKTNTIYDFIVKDIDGNDFDFSTLKGKKILIVNVASKCGFTPQYTELEKLYQNYKTKNLVIIAFPSNDFKEQEPGTDADIKQFCTLNYGVTFPIMSKISVKGENKAPIYKWLTEKAENNKLDAEIQWNFQKFMIDENGLIVDYLLPKESPLSDKILKWINN